MMSGGGMIDVEESRAEKRPGPNWVQPLKGLVLRFLSLEQQGRGPDKTVGFMISIVSVFFKCGLN